MMITVELWTWKQESYRARWFNDHHVVVTEIFLSLLLYMYAWKYIMLRNVLVLGMSWVKRLCLGSVTTIMVLLAIPTLRNQFLNY